jgi:hypothetical protein
MSRRISALLEAKSGVMIGIPLGPVQDTEAW